MEGRFPFRRAVMGPLAVAALALGAGCSRDAPTTPPPFDDAAPAATATAAATIDATLMLAHNPGSVRYEGRVGDAATRERLLRALRDAYGTARIDGSLEVDPAVRRAPWADRLAAFLEPPPPAGAMLRFAGERIELTGAVGDEDRLRLHETAQRLFPQATLAGLLQPPTVADTEPPPAVDDHRALVERLNRLEIRFEPDSGLIAPDSLDATTRAASMIKRAAVPVRIDVYPELSDQPDYDLKVARQRAQAVKIQLAIQGINPGLLDTQVHPVENTERAQAGRVEFATVQ